MMFDIVANSNWKRPIFCGGAFDNEDYIWMKKSTYSGMNYFANFIAYQNYFIKMLALRCGTIRYNKMYDIVMKWEWGSN
jgi:hypothetical protein